jgi:hypothetical protein
MRNDNCDITEVESRSANVENCDNSLRRANTDEVEAAAERDDQPHGIYRGLRELVDFTPDATRKVPLVLSYACDFRPKQLGTYLERGNASSRAKA